METKLCMTASVSFFFLFFFSTIVACCLNLSCVTSQPAAASTPQFNHTQKTTEALSQIPLVEGIKALATNIGRTLWKVKWSLVSSLFRCILKSVCTKVRWKRDQKDVKFSCSNNVHALHYYPNWCLLSLYAFLIVNWQYLVRSLSTVKLETLHPHCGFIWS